MLRALVSEMTCRLVEAQRQSTQPGRSRIRCDVPLWRLIRQPMRSNAATTPFAFADGQFRMGLSGWAGKRFAVLQAVGDSAKRQRLDGGGGLLSGAPVGGHAG